MREMIFLGIGVLLVSCVFLLSGVHHVSATSVPDLMNFQGRLTDSSGAPLSGSYSMTFKLYTTATGGSPVWAETHTTANGNAVTVTNGIFSTKLGSGTPIAPNTQLDTVVEANSTLYFEVTVGSDAPMTPRSQVATSAYAFNSDTLDGLDSSDFAAASGSANYIQNGADQQTANFNITGTGTASTLQAATLDTASSGTLSIGTTNATKIVLAQDTQINPGMRLSLGDALAYQSSAGSVMSFSSPTTYAANQARYANEVDFNNDGYNDVVTSDVQNNLASVLINKGDGTFKSAVSYSVGGYPEWIGYADVNRDGYQDIISANASDSSVSVLINKGDGTFQGAVKYTVGNAPKSANAVDVNGDGYPDLVVPNSNSDNVSVLMNNGDGTFSGAINYNLDSGAGPKYAAIVDVNHDGHADIVTANSGTNTVSVLMNSGDGTFGNPANYTVDASPRSEKVADVNHDGHPDIVTANNTNHTVSVLLNNGDGTFATQNTYDVGTSGYPVGVDVADINGDGNKDIITANSGNNTISIFPGNGDGTFAAPTIINSGNPRSMNVADVNNDGKLDIVAPDYNGNNLSVLLNTTSMHNHDAMLSINTGSAGNAGLILQGNTDQASDLLRVQTTGGESLFSVRSDGSAHFAGPVSGGAAVSADQFVTLGQVTNGYLQIGGHVSFQNTSDSATAFQIQNANSTSLLTADTSNMKIIMGSGGNTVTFSAAGLVATGTARHTKTIMLPAEYTGAVLDAASDSTCTSTHNGTMTSGYDSTGRTNFYKWTSSQSTAQCYDVVVQVPIPSDFDGWASAPSISMKKDSTGTGAYAIKVVDSTGTTDSNYNYTSPGTLGTSWANVATSTFGNTSGTNGTTSYVPGGYFTIKIRMSSTSGANVSLGNIRLTYNSKF